jgi:hypothetical protein
LRESFEDRRQKDPPGPIRLLSEYRHLSLRGKGQSSSAAVPVGLITNDHRLVIRDGEEQTG